jgi:Zn finger protein HypA/HybF involved in hydrogenase expression
MQVVREYDTAVQANASARHLLEHGIVAGVRYSTMRRRELEPGLGLHRHTNGAFRVLLASSADAADALLLLDAFDEEGVELPDDWEDQAEADLTRLAPEHAARCPACAKVLPADAGLTACANCGMDVDVVSLIAAQHGPEVLAELVPESGGGEDWLDPDLLVAADLPCERCRRGLSGVESVGECPWCGADVDKVAMVRRLFAEE